MAGETLSYTPQKSQKELMAESRYGAKQSASKGGVVDKGLDVWQTWNKVTLTAELGVALLIPALAVPALALAAIDGVQIVAINEVRKRKNEGKLHTVFDAKSHAQKNKPAQSQLALAA